MSIQKATVKDISLIQELARKSWENAYAEILSATQIEYMLENMYSEKEISEQIMMNPNFHYFILFDDEIPVGFLGFEHQYEPDTTKLHRIYLIPEAKGKGFGKMAINFLKNETLKNGDNRIILNVNKNNNARKIYESQGFTVFSEGIFDIGNGFVMDDFLMEIRL